MDPLAGSYYVENLTNRIEEKAMEYIEKIDQLGGAPRPLIRVIYNRRYRIVPTPIKSRLKVRRESWWA